MDLAFSDEDRAFQKEVKGWLDINWPEEKRQRARKSAMRRLSKEDHVTWQKALAQKGWATRNWPKEFKGASFTPNQNYMFDLETARVGAPGVIPFGISMVAPVIMKFGTDEQKKRFLPDIQHTNVWWCQGYSEPGSGSDLASVSMKAEDKGDHYLVNGTKTWTTLAQYADWIFCLVRTSHEEIRQKGISFLLIDMKSPGIEIAPIVTLDQPSEGYQEINSVFFTDVKVPKDQLVGEEGKGWTCAKYLLEFERGNAYSPGLKGAIKTLKSIAAQESDAAGGVLEDRQQIIDKISNIEVQVLALEFTEFRILSSLAAGQNVGPESSLLKTRGTELQQAITELAMELSGMYAVPLDMSTPNPGDNFQPAGPNYANGTTQAYFNTRKVSIFAGSNEIQRNIMSKLVLGL